MLFKFFTFYLLLFSLAQAKETKLTLSFSNGRDSKYGLEDVNKELLKIGVFVRKVEIPPQSHPLLHASTKRSLSSEEKKQLISYFSLHRGELLREINLAGRIPEAHRGGYLSTSEIGVAPYPKVYDMKSLSPETKKFLKKKFGRLHVNSSEAGVGIDEVMTIVSGGPYTWFFAFENGVVGKLRLPRIKPSDHAWRISYPGLVPHGGFFDADDGLVVAYAHGPENFVMRYRDPSVIANEVLNSNPWIDFSKQDPVLIK